MVMAMARAWGAAELLFAWEHRDEDAVGLAETLSRNVHEVRRKLKELSEQANERRNEGDQDGSASGSS
jgi:hypothetical protein